MTDKPKTVRVRVAVVVYDRPQGAAWEAVDAPEYHTDAVAFRIARQRLEEVHGHVPTSEHIITAEVPLPAPPAEIPGEVEDMG